MSRADHALEVVALRRVDALTAAQLRPLLRTLARRRPQDVIEACLALADAERRAGWR